MSKHERQVESAESEEKSDGFLAELKRDISKNAGKIIFWGVIGALIFAAI